MCMRQEPWLFHKNLAWISIFMSSPRVVLWQDTSARVYFINTGRQAVAVVETPPTGVQWILAGVYASNNCVKRRRLWRLLLDLQHLHLPLAVTGDFSVLLEASEKCGGLFVEDIEVLEFRDCVNGMDFVYLVQHPSLEYFWSWSFASCGESFWLTNITIISVCNRFIGNKNLVLIA